jgi:hypothetical protein
MKKQQRPQPKFIISMKTVKKHVEISEGLFPKRVQISSRNLEHEQKMRLRGHHGNISIFHEGCVAYGLGSDSVARKMGIS